VSFETLLQQFHVVVDAPNGVHRLRDLILQLAVRGKLVPPDPTDESASVLLQGIAAEPERLIREGKTGKRSRLPPIRDDELRFDVPDGSVPIRLGELGSWAIGSGFPTAFQGSRDGSILFCKVSDMNLPGNEREILATQNTIDNAVARLIGAKIHPAGTVIFPKIGGAIATNKRRILVRPTAIDNNCLGLTPNVECSTGWLFLLLSSIDMTRYQAGTSVPALSQGSLELIPFILPRLAEQHRIVAKVDELMALCDRVEAQQQRRAELRARLNRSALHRLSDACDDAELSAHWQRLRENFHLLYDVPETVAELRQAVLQLAVRGRLTRQDPGDEPASVLLTRIAAAKEHLGNQGKIAKPRTMAPIGANDLPFAAPEGWKWARFADVATIASNLVDPADFPDQPHVAPDNIEKGTGRLLAYLSVQEDAVSSNNHRFFAGQILYSKIRPNLSKAVLVDFGGLCSADMYPLDAHISARYLLTYILSSTFLRMVIKNDTRVAMPKINQAELSRVLVPVPPLAEQYRIAARVDAILALCRTLEFSLTRALEKSAHVAASLVHHLTAA
jgi:type I restriction enzyme S subunit